MKHPILSAYNTFNKAPIALWSFNAAGNLTSDRPDLPPALLIDSVCRAVERSQNGPLESLLLTGGYVTFPVTSLLDVGTEDFSICAWIRTEDYGIVKIIDKRIENSGPLQGWSFFIYQSKINLQIADEKGWLNCGSDRLEKIVPFPVVSDNQWHHVAVVVDRDRADGGHWYVDGKEVAYRFRPIHQQGSLSNNMPLTVGRRAEDFGGIYRGNIGDILLYKQALSAADVLSIYRSIQSPINNKFFVNILKRPEIARPEQDSFSDSNNSTLERYSQAMEYYQESLNIHRNNCNGYGEANSLNNLGNIYNALGEYSQAIECHQQCLKIEPEIGNLYGEPNFWRDLGSAYHSLGEYQQAIECQLQSLDMARKINSKHRELNSLNALGRTYVSLGQNQLAIEYCEKSLNLAPKIDNRFGEANSLVILGNAYSNLGHYLRAIAFYKQSLDIQQEMGDRSGEATFWRNLGNAYRCLGQYQRAIEYSRKSLEIARAIGIRKRDFNPTLKIDPGDLVKLHDDAPNWEPWQVISVDQTHNILSLCQSSWPAGLTIPRPAIDVAAKVESSVTNHPRLQKLHQLLIEPIADLLPTDPAAKIIFIPQGELFFVPFSALQDAAGKYLIEKHTILTAPAIQILELTSQKRQEISNLGGDILVVGNPTMPEVALVPGKPPQQLSALPHSETEANAIAQLFQTQALTGNSATKSAVLQRLSDARIVHFATHGLLDRTRGLGSAIAFAPDRTDSGLLTAEEILHLHLQADLVVLSACNTGMGRITGDGAIGLSRALISAGTVRSCLCGRCQMLLQPI